MGNYLLKLMTVLVFGLFGSVSQLSAQTETEVGDYTLKVYEFNGDVTVTPSDDGTQVTVEVTPADGYYFVNWCGSESSKENPFTFVMDSDKTMMATIREGEAPVVNYSLNLQAANGSVGVTPAGTEFVSGTPIELIPTAAAGYEFIGWSGDASGTANPLTLVMDANKNITALFEAEDITPNPGVYTLDVTSDNGTIAVSADGPYAQNQIIQVTATPALGYEFAQWSGDVIGVLNPLTVNMNSDKNITAVYTYVGQEYQITLGDYANGTVTLSDNGPRYDKDSQVTFTATADEGYDFIGWSGDATGDTNPLVITMDGDKNITPIFEEEVPLPTGPNLLANGEFDNGDAGWTPQFQGSASGTLDVPNDGLLSGANSGRLNIASSGGAQYQVELFHLFNMEAGKTYEVLFTGSANANTNVIAFFQRGSAPWTNYAPPGENVVLTETVTEFGPYYFTPTLSDPQARMNFQLGGTPATEVRFDNVIVREVLDEAPSTYSITVNSTNGTVARSIAGPDYEPGTSVTLTATAATDYAFTGWSGDYTGTENPLTVQVDSNLNITANYESTAPPTYALTINSQYGTVARSIEGPYPSGTAVELTVTANPNWQFTGWTGAYEGTENPLTVQIDAATELTANYESTLPAPEPGDNLLFNGEFDQGTANWTAVFKETLVLMELLRF